MRKVSIIQREIPREGDCRVGYCGGTPGITVPDRALFVGKAETDLHVLDLVATRLYLPGFGPLLSCNHYNRGYQTLHDKTDRRVDHLHRGGADCWRKHGLPEDRVIPYNNTIDVEGLRKAGADVPKERLMELRHNLRIEGKRVLLFSGRLYTDKKVDFLLMAFALLKKSYSDVALLNIGDGEERDNLEPDQTTLWISSETYTTGRTQEDDAVVFFQPPQSSANHLLAD